MFSALGLQSDRFTLEAALCKLMVLLGDPDLTQEDIEDSYQRALVGEQSASVFVTRYPVKPGSVERTPGQMASVRIPGRPIEGTWQPANVRNALLRFRGAKLRFAGDPPVLFSAYLNLDKPEEANKSHPGYAGVFKKEPTEKEDQIFVFDVTRVVTALLKARPKVLSALNRRSE